MIGQDAIREAFTGDLRDLEGLLRGAIREILDMSGEQGDWWVHVHGLFCDFIVIETKKGRLLRYGYSIDGTKVTLDQPVEVMKAYVPVHCGCARCFLALTRNYCF
ncbi:MAG: hypothetical protein GKR94_21815 [Gammaproteobacteria bacterium]|nr:hypothetical protein [Gammaproteobacteria bacterium]